MREALYRAYASVRDRVAPEIEYSQLHYERLLARHVNQGIRWLDLGCGHQMLPPWRQDAEHQLAGRASILVGLDPDLVAIRQHPHLSHRIAGFGDDLPFADETFDLVSANMVIEHVANPLAVFSEVLRVLRPGGRFVFHTPNRNGYPTQLARLFPPPLKRALAGVLHGRRAEDVYPTHYRANAAAEISALANAAGFAGCQAMPVCSDAILAIVPVIGWVELAVLKLLNTERLASFRPNLLVVLTRSGTRA